MYLVRCNNRTIAVVSYLKSAMAIFRANKYFCSWLQVIDTTTGKVIVYWIG